MIRSAFATALTASITSTIAASMASPATATIASAFASAFATTFSTARAATIATRTGSTAFSTTPRVAAASARASTATLPPALAATSALSAAVRPRTLRSVVCFGLVARRGLRSGRHALGLVGPVCGAHNGTQSQSQAVGDLPPAHAAVTQGLHVTGGHGELGSGRLRNALLAEVGAGQLQRHLLLARRNSRVNHGRRIEHHNDVIGPSSAARQTGHRQRHPAKAPGRKKSHECHRGTPLLD